MDDITSLAKSVCDAQLLYLLDKVRIVFDDTAEPFNRYNIFSSVDNDFVFRLNDQTTYHEMVAFQTRQRRLAEKDVPVAILLYYLDINLAQHDLEKLLSDFSFMPEMPRFLSKVVSLYKVKQKPEIAYSKVPEIIEKCFQFDASYRQQDTESLESDVLYENISEKFYTFDGMLNKLITLKIPLELKGCLLSVLRKILMPEVSSIEKYFNTMKSYLSKLHVDRQ